MVQLFRTLSVYDVFDDWLTGQRGLFPYDEPNELSLRAIRTAFWVTHTFNAVLSLMLIAIAPSEHPLLEEIFSRSIAFFEELNGATAEQLELKLPFDDSEVDGSLCYMSRLDEHCSGLVWTHDVSVDDYVVQVSCCAKVQYAH